jgi:hypothetical protein
MMQRIVWTTTMFGLLVSVGMAQAAPKQLLNKTIAFSYNVQSVQRDPDGRTRNINTAINYLWYVSNAGRIFERSSRSPSAGSSQTGQFGPDSASTSKTGEGHDVHFEGNKLVSLRSFAAGASRTLVSFDPSFTGCTVSVQQGKQGGIFKRKMTDGVIREVLSMSTSGETCSVREGNPFAN